MASRILFTCRPLTGHFDPLLPLAAAARDAGHTVAFASGAPVTGQAADAGYESFEAGPPDTFRAEWAPRFPAFRSLVGDDQRRFFFIEIFANLELVPRAADLERIIATWHPDLVVHEVAELAAPMVSTALGIPYVDVGYGALIPRTVLLAAGAAAAPHWRRCGLEPHPLAGLFRTLYVDPCPAALQNPEIADLSPVQRVRPAVGPTGDVVAGTRTRPSWLAARGDRPIVYVTLGTIWNTDLDLFRRVIEALRDDVDVIVTLGRQHDPAALGPQPPGVMVHGFVPQHELLPWCDAVVAHGGSGTTLGALAHGRPLLILPQGADQWSNGERVVAAGAGRMLLRDEASSEAIRDAVIAVLTDASYGDGARTVQSQIAAMPPAADAISRFPLQ